MTHSIKFLSFVLSIAFSFLLISFSAQASVCKTYNDQEICILSIKRSAKYYWRYRTEISINGKRKSKRIYDCRQRQITEKNNLIIPFAKDGIEQF